MLHLQRTLFSSVFLILMISCEAQMWNSCGRTNNVKVKLCLCLLEGNPMETFEEVGVSPRHIAEAGSRWRVYCKVITHLLMCIAVLFVTVSVEPLTVPKTPCDQLCEFYSSVLVNDIASLLVRLWFVKKEFYHTAVLWKYAQMIISVHSLPAVGW